MENDREIHRRPSDLVFYKCSGNLSRSHTEMQRLRRKYPIDRSQTNPLVFHLVRLRLRTAEYRVALRFYPLHIHDGFPTLLEVTLECNHRYTGFLALFIQLYYKD